MKKIVLFSAVALWILATVGCKKKGLPEATQIGANTLGCVINGVPYECSGKLNTKGIPTPGIDIAYNDSILWIRTSKYGDKGKGVFFSFEYDGGLGKYTNIKDVVEGSNSYVEITRFSDGVISGYFEMTLRDINIAAWEDKKPVAYDTTIIKYTDGRFDIEL